MCTSDVFLALLSILFPPIAVWIKRSICSADSLINIALCCLGYVPGLLHAWYIIAKYPEDPESEYQTVPSDQGEQGGRVTYYSVNQSEPSTGQQQHHPLPKKQQQSKQQTGYGTVPNQGMNYEAPGQGSSSQGVPPTYEQAVKGDHKVQT